MKKLIKKWWFLGITILTIVISIMYILVFSNNSSAYNNYSKQAISILNQYKEGQLTGKESSNKLNALSKKIDNETNSDDKYESVSMFALQMKLSNIALKLFNGELSNTQINNYIEEIKKIK